MLNYCVKSIEKKNKEKLRIQLNLWRKNNKEKVRFQDKIRWAREHNADGLHTLGEWKLLKKQYGYRCPDCKKQEPEIQLTEDHIIPLKKGGSNYIENIQPLCRSCNASKGTKIIKFNF